jgi:hypothetical protein
MVRGSGFKHSIRSSRTLLGRGYRQCQALFSMIFSATQIYHTNMEACTFVGFCLFESIVEAFVILVTLFQLKRFLNYKIMLHWLHLSKSREGKITVGNDCT